MLGEEAIRDIILLITVDYLFILSLSLPRLSIYLNTRQSSI